MLLTLAIIYAVVAIWQYATIVVMEDTAMAVFWALVWPAVAALAVVAFFLELISSASRS